MLNQDNHFDLISLSILIPCSLDNVWILWEEIKCYSLLGFTGLLRGGHIQNQVKLMKKFMFFAVELNVQ